MKILLIILICVVVCEKPSGACPCCLFYICLRAYTEVYLNLPYV